MSIKEGALAEYPGEEARLCPLCGVQLGATREGAPMLLCPRHWRRVSMATQQRVWKTWKQLTNELATARRLGASSPAQLAEETRQAYAAYRASQDTAISEAAQGDPVAQEASS